MKLNLSTILLKENKNKTMKDKKFKENKVDLSQYGIKNYK